MKTRITGMLFTMLLVLSFVLTGCQTGRTVVLGSKDFSENIVLGEIFAQLIEAKTDIRVERKLNMGGTFVCFESLVTTGFLVIVAGGQFIGLIWYRKTSNVDCAIIWLLIRFLKER